MLPLGGSTTAAARADSSGTATSMSSSSRHTRLRSVALLLVQRVLLCAAPCEAADSRKVE